MPKGSRVKIAALLISIVFIGAPAHANVVCSGPVTYVALSPDGTVMLRVGSFGVWYICSVTTTYAGNTVSFSPESCRAWYASFLAAQKAGHTLDLYFTSSASGFDGPECTGLATWVIPSPSPYHLRVKGE